MATRSFVRHALRLAAVLIAATILTAGPALLPALPLHASTSAPTAPAAIQAAPPLLRAMDQGIIAYVQRSTTDIRLISPDGANDRLLWDRPDSPNLSPAIDLAWRPDGRELAFTSEHENACSWYDSDIFAIGYNGVGYRRITNSPACAVLATLPQGAVTVNVNNYTSTPIWVYVAGAPEVNWVNYSGTVTFEKVADFGSGVYQPSIGIYGLTRFVSYPPYADVVPGQTVAGGNITLMSLSGFRGFGAGKVSWKADGSTLAYALRTRSEIDQLPAVPPYYGQTGVKLPVVENASPELVAWGKTTATADQYVYYTGDDWMHEGVGGIYLNTVGDESGGVMLVRVHTEDAQYVRDIEWLPDGSGFLFTVFYVELGYFTDIFEYNLAQDEITQLTHLPRDADYAYNLSISPDGQQVVFERRADDFDTTSSLWLMNRDGSGLHKLLDDAGRPAWGRIPPPLTPRVYLPVLLR